MHRDRPYRKPAKHPRKPPYTSKEYQLFRRYLRAKCQGLKVGSTSNRANANKKLVAFKVPSPDGTLKFAREERRVTSITIG